MSGNIDDKSAILDMVPPITIVENPRKQVSILFGDDKNDEIMISDAVRIYKEDGTEAWLKVQLGDFRKLEFVCNSDNTKVEDIELSDEEEKFEAEELDDEESDEEESEDEGSENEGFEHEGDNDEESDNEH
ncbi:hypothetical protein L5515_002665 [Caenorhabditis briggsae]|uniref:Uncharacterized protein n=1 Tax=Caenorhabditis briggsae TaxID=6238 RepID=A0AAE9J609_CAEBR|nr:hypothetical protein L5515_002665 [Caenorhabditis briggsae]